MRWSTLIVFIGFLGCSSPPPKTAVIEEVSLEGSGNTELPGPQFLSQWNLFEGDQKRLVPTTDLVHYEINMPLFSDYAFKKRFIRLPEGQLMTFKPKSSFDFPVGTVLVKNFYYPEDFNHPEKDIRVLETRLLVRDSSEWYPLSYLWNDDQSDAELLITGASVPISWLDKEGVSQTIDYSVPNLAQCKSCHDIGGKLVPLGPNARQLNNTVLHPNSNQLVAWKTAGLIKEMPELADIDMMPGMDKNVETPLLAKAWLDVNCGHCHQENGPARNTGLHLTYYEQDLYRLGLNKPPVAAGRGSAGLMYDIVAGKPDESILMQRIESLDPGIMMPELGRKLQHKEGIDLIRKWILEMENKKAS